MSSVTKLSRDEWKKAKELDELRKQGIAPPALDNEGNMINPHIPQFISNTPWYIQNDNTSGLKHQRAQQHKQLQFSGSDLNLSYNRGQDTVVENKNNNNKYVKGACINCGSMTHNSKSCLERPRAKNAKQLGKTLNKYNDTQLNLNLNYDQKHDRWAGYKPETYMDVIQQYEHIEQQKKKQKLNDKTKKQNDKQNNDNNNDSDDISDISSSDDEDNSNNNNSNIKQSTSNNDMNDSGAVIQSVDDKTKHTVRNLRLREDTAKYLHNLNVNSAYYDPKSRSMRDNPFLPSDPRYIQYEQQHNFVKQNDEIKKYNEIQNYVWETSVHNNNNENIVDSSSIHSNALPTAVEHAYKEYQNKKKLLLEQQQKQLNALYGSNQSVPQHIKQQIIEQQQIDSSNDTTVDDNVVDDGIKQESSLPSEQRNKSIYDEDIYINNHSSVWGSYYDINTNKWGYKCCHQFIKNSYCTGNDGVKAEQTSNKAKLDAINNSNSHSNTNTNYDTSSSNG